MSQQQQSPYYAGNYPPPLFAAELDSSAPSSRFASAQGPDGAPVFEMPGEPVPSKQNGEEKRPSRTQSPAQANPWPFYLDGQAPSKPAQEDDKDKPYKDPSAAPQPVMANPWAYFGPEASEDTPAPLAIASGRRPVNQNPSPPPAAPQSEEDRRPSGPVYKPYPGNSESVPQVPHGTRPPASTSPSPSDGDPSYYPAPLKLGGRPAKTTSPPAFKPYSPPPSHDVQDTQVRPLAGIGRTDSQSTTTSMPYRPYRPHSPQTETTAAAPAANIPPTTSPPPPAGTPASLTIGTPPAGASAVAPAPPVASTPTPPVTAQAVAPAPLAPTPPATTPAPVAAVPAPTPSGTIPAPQQQPAGASPHHFHSPAPTNPPVNPPRTDASVSPKPTTTAPASEHPRPPQYQQPQPQQQHHQPQPQQNGIAGAAPAQGAPSVASPYLPSPMSPS
ncbi:hypothetical protein NW767_003714, partial [Fusarium falciforme]